MRSLWAFPGQGSQRKGMGDELFDRHQALVRRADEILGYSLRRLCLEDPDGVLGQTRYTQPALFAVSALSFIEKRDAGETLPAIFAGHSLGEFNALFAAGAFDFETGIALVDKRGRLMTDAPRGAMAAVIGLDQERVASLIAASPFDRIDLANINAADQIVISGDYDQIAACETLFTGAGGRFVRLNVSAAFHSRFMRDVEREYADFLAGFDLKPLEHPVIANRTARPYPKTGYRDLISEQISHPVRWYESMSWLLAHGLETFAEVGPGTVLSGLFAKIRRTPMTLPASAASSPAASSAVATEVAATGAQTQAGPKIVFMYSGQGSQYYAMGKELYENNPVFRAAMDDCDTIYRAQTGRSMVVELYDPANRHRELSDVMLSHPALYSLGYALTQALIDAGIRPDAVLGYSLGEYVAATVSGAMRFEDALRMVMRQAELVRERASGGGMLSVMTPVEHLHRHPQLYAGCILASVNFDGNFVISGGIETLRALKRALDAESILSVLLPVEHSFHSPAMDAIEGEFRRFLAGVEMGAPNVPAYSSMSATRVERFDAEHFWNVIRCPVEFHKLVGEISGSETCRFIDLSPTGALSTFIKYGYGGRVAHAASMNQFGRDTATLAKLRSDFVV
ncbi:MAG: ACP S-malonyltransferase [Xanthomonadales bacterium]|nr:ACP S-malonyltransferase [Xanthomonadales bacterium]